MSLARLLAAGKSLAGLKGAKDRYNLPNRRVLPTFEAKQNPFRSESPARKAGAAEATQARPEQAASSSDLPDRQQISSASAHSGTERETKSPFDRIAKLFTGRENNSGRRARGLVQAELSLETVKVVRNDLTDSDLEVVSAQKVAASSDKSPAVAPISVEPAVASGEPAGQPVSLPAAPQKIFGARNDMKGAAGALVGRLFGANKP